MIRTLNRRSTLLTKFQVHNVALLSTGPMLGKRLELTLRALLKPRPPRPSPLHLPSPQPLATTTPLTLVYGSILFFYINLCVHLGHAGSHCEGSLESSEQGLLSSCGARAPHCGGLSCCGVWAPGCTGLWSCSSGLSSCGSRAPEHRFRSHGTRA